MTGTPTTTMAPEPLVTVLLALCNGAPFLGAQLDSLATQTVRVRNLIVADDGSTDDSIAVLSGWISRHRPTAVLPDAMSVRLLTTDAKTKQRLGSAGNFIRLLAMTPADPGFVALSDQDDVWLPEKMRRALTALEAVPVSEPALYCGATWICDAKLSARTLSELPTRAPGFAHALVQNIASGNTIVLNPAASILAQSASRELCAAQSDRHGLGPVLHDWWLYQLVTGAGGRVLFDPVPQILYRQHGSNLVGAGDGANAKAHRIGLALGGRFRRWTDANLETLGVLRRYITLENQQLLDAFVKARRLPMPARLWAMRRLGLYRQTWRGTATLWLAIALNKL